MGLLYYNIHTFREIYVMKTSLANVIIVSNMYASEKTYTSSHDVERLIVDLGIQGGKE